jgi:membrane protease YdiL (CAAX protease family)
VAEFLLVPLGEESLFRGFLLGVLLTIFNRWLPARDAARSAVLISAAGFAAGHLGNLGYVPTAFVLLQCLVAMAFGTLAGWLRLRTDSLAGPVLIHAVMNVGAVA